MSLSLSELYDRILKKASRASGLATIEDETQDLITQCLDDLRTLHTRIIEFSIFSPNETLEDISSRDLVYLSVPYVFSEVQSRVKTPNRTDRLKSLKEAEKYTASFIGLLEKYGIVPKDEVKLYGRKTGDVGDFAKRRELKINQYKKEKELTARIETLRTRGGKNPASDYPASDYDLISSLIPSPSPKKTEDEDLDLDSETDDILRETTLLLLRLFYARAASQLQGMEQELELLKNAPPSPTNGPDDSSMDPRDKRREEEDNAWKLDVPVPGGPDGKGPLMDASGKPLRPFTILPSDAGERARLQAQVFGPGYNLPTMSIDEYLEVERQRGKFISGGGAASQNAPTSSEQLAIDSEMDGTVEGESKAEEKRQKDENWARYTDENPRGAGNRINRG